MPEERKVNMRGNKAILIVFDGLRPDFIDTERMPNLEAFARRSTWFREARSVFPSMTRVATTSIATGAAPGMHGLVGNAFYFPKVVSDRILDLGSLSDIALAEEVTNGRLIELPSFGDCVATAGKTMAVVSTGAPGTTYCLNPRASRNRQWTFTLGGPLGSPTPEAVNEVVQRFGPPPSKSIPRIPEMNYATTIMVEHVLQNLAPDLSVIWFNEPDTSFHYKGLVGADTNCLLKCLDANFGRIFDWVKQQQDADRYTIVVASDHGHIATDKTVDLIGRLNSFGFTTRHLSNGGLKGCSVAFTGWNTGEATLLTRDKSDIEKLVRVFQDSEQIGCIFTPGRNEVEGVVKGTFSFDLANIDHPRRPDILFTLLSSDKTSVVNVPGSGGIEASCGVLPPGGMHGGLNRYELNSTLIANGSLFEARIAHQPSGIVDIGPTLLKVLEIPVPESMSGRPLFTRNGSSEGELKAYQVETDGFAQTVARIETGPTNYLHSGGRTV